MVVEGEGESGMRERSLAEALTDLPCFIFDPGRKMVLSCQ